MPTSETRALRRDHSCEMDTGLRASCGDDATTRRDDMWVCEQHADWFDWAAEMDVMLAEVGDAREESGR